MKQRDHRPIHHSTHYRRRQPTWNCFYSGKYQDKPAAALCNHKQYYTDESGLAGQQFVMAKIFINKQPTKERAASCEFQ